MDSRPHAIEALKALIADNSGNFDLHGHLQEHSGLDVEQSHEVVRFMHQAGWIDGITWESGRSWEFNIMQPRPLEAGYRAMEQHAAGPSGFSVTAGDHAQIAVTGANSTINQVMHHEETKDLSAALKELLGEGRLDTEQAQAVEAAVEVIDNPSSPNVAIAVLRNARSALKGLADVARVQGLIDSAIETFGTGGMPDIPGL